MSQENSNENLSQTPPPSTLVAYMIWSAAVATLAFLLGYSVIKALIERIRPNRTVHETQANTSEDIEMQTQAPAPAPPQGSGEANQTIILHLTNYIRITTALAEAVLYWIRLTAELDITKARLAEVEAKLARLKQIVLSSFED
ncbi:MAG: hypothetical protein M1829_003863 [Trizodia sp. TS-e1964]|nr:MAG: hypothetical protein M1829_003863 [Trizodia sp. TS-e1964]